MRRGERDGPVVVAKGGIQSVVAPVVASSSRTSSSAATAGDAGPSVERGQGVEEALLLSWLGNYEFEFLVEREREGGFEVENEKMKKRKRSIDQSVVALGVGGLFLTHPTPLRGKLGASRDVLVEAGSLGNPGGAVDSWVLIRPHQKAASEKKKAAAAPGLRRKKERKNEKKKNDHAFRSASPQGAWNESSCLPTRLVLENLSSAAQGRGNARERERAFPERAEQGARGNALFRGRRRYRKSIFDAWSSPPLALALCLRARKPPASSSPLVPRRRSWTDLSIRRSKPGKKKRRRSSEGTGEARIRKRKRRHQDDSDRSFFFSIDLSFFLPYRSGGAAAPAPTPAPPAARRQRSSPPSNREAWGDSVRSALAPQEKEREKERREERRQLQQQQQALLLARRGKKNGKKLLRLLLLIFKPRDLQKKRAENYTKSDSVIRDPPLRPPHPPGAEGPQRLGEDLVFRSEHPLGERRGVVFRVQNRHGPLRQDGPSVEYFVDEVDSGAREPRARRKHRLVHFNAVKPFPTKGTREQSWMDVEHAAGEGPDEWRRDELEVASEGDDVDSQASRSRGRSGMRASSPCLAVGVGVEGKEQLPRELLRSPLPERRFPRPPGLQGGEAARLYPSLLGPGPAAAAGNVGDDDLGELRG